MNDVVARIRELAIRGGLTVAAAESCTGGALSARLTDLSGASTFFLGGVISYSNRLKIVLLGVPEETLAKYGAVSSETARAMAEGARVGLSSDVAVGITGVAGPGGGTVEKPVGLVFVGLSDRQETSTHRLSLSGDRAAIRRQAVDAALRLLLERLEALASAGSA